MIKNKIKYIKLLFFLQILLYTTVIISCSHESPIVPPNQQSEENLIVNSGTIYPQIQLVNPGGLQTLSVPEAIETGVDPNNPGIVVVFTRSMENDGGELAGWVQLYQGATPVATTLTANTTNNTVILTPAAALANNTVYTIRISANAYVDDVSSLTMEFSNLEDPPATTLNPASPAYVEYSFRTSTGSPADTTDPTLNSTNPANGATGVTTDLNATNGYIEIIFNDDITPMINPTTVNTTSVTLTGSLSGAISGDVILVTSDTDLKTYRFIPDYALSYNETCTLTLTNAITDMSGNTFAGATIVFNTGGIASPVIDNWEVTAIGTTTATIIWTTDRNSIKHIDLEPGTTFPGVNYVAPPDDHNVTLTNTFTHNATGLTANTAYSFRIAADADNAVTSAGPFDTTLDANLAFRTLPDTTEGATGNYELATLNNTDKSELSPVVINQDESFIIWKDDTTIYGQYINSSFAGEINWDRWPNTGDNSGIQIFNADGDLDVISNGSNDAIVTRTNTDIFSESIYNNAGVLGRRWGGGAAGVTVYDGGTANNARAALSYSGYVTEITSGTCSLQYIYDTTANFAAVANGDNVINQNTGTQTTVANTIDNNFFETAAVITSGTNYRIADSGVFLSDTMDNSGVNIFLTDSDFSLGDVVSDTGTDWAYITNKIGAGPWWYTANRDFGIGIGNPFNVYSYIENGTCATNILYENGTDFSAGVSAGDIAVNMDTGDNDTVNNIYAGTNEALVLTSGTTFDGDGENYQILRLPSDCTLITSGRNTGFAGLDVTQTGRDFDAAGVQAGDIIYNIVQNQYTVVTSALNTTISTNIQIFTAAGQAFIVFRYNSQAGVTYTWEEGNDIYIKTKNLADAALVHPDATTASNILVTNSANNCRYPYIINDNTSGVIVIYELANGGNWDICAKKVAPLDQKDGGDSALFIWSNAAADEATDDGIDIVTNQAANTATGKLITDVIADGNGGAWVIYENDSDIGVRHINSAGTVTNIATIASAERPSAIKYSATNIAVAYEDYITVGTDTVKRIRVQRYTSAAAAGGALNVRSADESYSQINPFIQSDGNNGFLVSWLETKYYPSIYYSLFAQHFNNAMTRVYLNDKFVGIPVLDNQATTDPYTIEHIITRYNDGAVPNAGIFFWLDERSANTKDIYFQNVPD